MPTTFTNLTGAVEYWNRKIRQDFPARAELTVEQCIRLRREGFVPGRKMKFYGFEAEIISYPFPAKGVGAALKVREPGKPETMVEAFFNPSVFSILEG